MLSGEAANEGLSGQIPVSMSPITTPSPAFAVPPSDAHRPCFPERPRKSVEFVSLFVLFHVSGVTDTTTGSRVSSTA